MQPRPARSTSVFAAPKLTLDHNASVNDTTVVGK